jgi:EXLDI family protein
MYTHKRFLARELARRRTRDSEHHIVTEIVYQTAKGRLVLNTRISPDWSAWAGDWDWDVDPTRGSRHRRRERGRGGDWSDWGKWGRQDWSTGSEGSEHRMDVYETLDDLKPHIDETLYNAVVRALRGEDDEFLDI